MQGPACVSGSLPKAVLFPVPGQGVTASQQAGALCKGGNGRAAPPPPPCVQKDSVWSSGNLRNSKELTQGFPEQPPRGETLHLPLTPPTAMPTICTSMSLKAQDRGPQQDHKECPIIATTVLRGSSQHPSLKVYPPDSFFIKFSPVGDFALLG